MAKIEIEGLDPLIKALDALPREISAPVIREVARRPANKILARARDIAGYLLPLGHTKRIFGILRVSSPGQMFLEIGLRGRSLAGIFMFSKGRDRHKRTGASTGVIQPVGNITEMAAEQVGQEVTKEMQIDLSKAIAKALKKYNSKMR